MTMVNSVIYFFLAIAVFEAAGAGITADHIEKLKAVKEKCRNEFGIEESVILEFTRERKLPETEKGKCAVACFLKELEVLNEGKISMDRLKEIGKDKWEDEETSKKAGKIAEDCIQQVSAVTNECDVATQFVGCMYTNAKQAGIQLPKMHHH